MKLTRTKALELAARVSEIQKIIEDAGTTIAVTIENDEPQTDGVYVEGLANLLKIAVHRSDVEPEFLGDDSDYKYRVTTRIFGVDFHTVCTEAELRQHGLEA